MRVFKLKVIRPIEFRRVRPARVLGTSLTVCLHDAIGCTTGWINVPTATPLNGWMSDCVNIPAWFDNRLV